VALDSEKIWIENQTSEREGRRRSSTPLGCKKSISIPAEGEGCDLLGHAELANPYFLYLYDCYKGWTMELCSPNFAHTYNARSKMQPTS
jgi:hypothetical protein